MKVIIFNPISEYECSTLVVKNSTNQVRGHILGTIYNVIFQTNEVVEMSFKLSMYDIATEKAGIVF